MQNILISVLVVSYNSEKYIIETLESVKNQTYRNIELIISDDNSTDRTIELATKWLEENDTMFIKTKLIKYEINTGIAPNVNRGIKQCNGVFIKPIAADDILIYDCIEKNLEYCLNNDLKVLFSRQREFRVINGKKEFKVTKVDKEFFNLSPERQLDTLMIINKVDAPTGFYATSFFECFGLFDEGYPFFDDLPYWIRMTSNGYKLNFMDQVTVLYRRHEDSVQTINQINRNYFRDLYKFFKDVRKPYFIKHMMFLTLIDFEILFKNTRDKIRNNGKSTWKIQAILLLSPIRVYAKLASELHKLTSRFKIFF